ncbi:MAG: hypothetical protein AAFR33_11540 [Pseudomonadota bacterium]
MSFIAHAREDLPAALDEIEGLQAENARLRSEKAAAVNFATDAKMLAERVRLYCAEQYAKSENTDQLWGETLSNVQALQGYIGRPLRLEYEAWETPDDR